MVYPKTIQNMEDSRGRATSWNESTCPEHVARAGPVTRPIRTLYGIGLVFMSHCIIDNVHLIHFLFLYTHFLRVYDAIQDIIYSVMLSILVSISLNAGWWWLGAAKNNDDA